MDDQATMAVRKKRNSSMRVAIDLAAKPEADAVLSAGNTGAMYAMVKFVVGTLPGVDRLPLAALFPHPAGAFDRVGCRSKCRLQADAPVGICLDGIRFTRKRF